MKQVSAILLLVVLTGCGGYDRELLGDPELQPASSSLPPPATANPAPSVPAPVETAEGDYYYTQDVPEELDVGLFSDLNYYGSWHVLDPYGWVWRPIVGIDWRPYVAGHWSWTEYGWMWISYEPFGWAVYHYGYWTRDFALGWVWIPDYEWSANRVTWILIDDNVAWCPLPPPAYGYEPIDWFWYEPINNPWIAVPCDDFLREDVGTYRRPVKYKSGYSETRMRRGAPEPRDVERWTSRGVKVMPVRIDHRVVGDREFALIELPADQQRIVDSRKNPGTTPPPARYKPSPVVDTGTPPPPSVQPPPSNNNPPTTGSKTKTPPKSEPEKSDKKEAPKPYKEKDREERSKGESKPKSKGR